MIGEGTWIEEEWFEYSEIIIRFRSFLKKRGIKTVFRRNMSGATMRMNGSYTISVKRGATDTSKIGMLIHEFSHFELGHRGTKSNEEYARQEIEACLVEHVVLWMFKFAPDPEDYIFRHAFWLPDIYGKAWNIASQLKNEVFLYGRKPRNHRQLIG